MKGVLDLQDLEGCLAPQVGFESTQPSSEAQTHPVGFRQASHHGIYLNKKFLLILLIFMFFLLKKKKSFSTFYLRFTLSLIYEGLSFSDRRMLFSFYGIPFFPPYLFCLASQLLRKASFPVPSAVLQDANRLID